MKILILSCDKNDDLFEPFHHCMEKYWPEHPEIIYTTETKINPFYKTICKNYDLAHGTRRIQDTLKEIDDSHILLLCDDSFLRKRPDALRLAYYDKLLDEIDNVNLEPSFDRLDESCQYPGLLKRSPGGHYKTSVMMSMGNKKKLLEVLDFDADPGHFEVRNNHCNFLYYINGSKTIVDIGHYKAGDIGGVYRGKGTKECLRFFDDEGIKIEPKRDLYD